MGTRPDTPGAFFDGDNMGQESPKLGQGVKMGQGGNKTGQEGVKIGQGDEKSGQEGEKLGQNTSKSGEDEGTTRDTESDQNSSYAYETPSYLTVEDSEEAECLKEVLEQLERERRDLILGNREISYELNKLDTTNTETVSTLRKLARENSSLRRDLAAMREREDSSRREMERSAGREEYLTHKVAMLKQALQQASTASSLNTSLQQEVARLTEDNLVSPSLPPLSPLPPPTTVISPCSTVFSCY